jgi:hypothetical protein
MLNLVRSASAVQQIANDIDLFESFWTLYPRRESKKDARKAWSEIDPSQHELIFTALASWRAIFLARESTQFIPYAATWLRGERWDDEIPQEKRAPRPAAQVQFGPTAEPTPKCAIPSHVQAMIDRIKTGR